MPTTQVKIDDQQKGSGNRTRHWMSVSLVSKIQTAFSDLTIGTMGTANSVCYTGSITYSFTILSNCSLIFVLIFVLIFALSKLRTK